MPHSAERQHLRSIFAGRYVAHGFSLGAHRAALRSQMPVGIDLHLNAAITENSLGYDRDHVDAVHLRRNDERCGLVIRIRRARANRGHKRFSVAAKCTVPFAATLQKRLDRFAALQRTVQHDMRIEAHQFALVIAIAVARSGSPRLDVAKHWTCITADGVVSHAPLRRPWPESPHALGAASPEFCGGVCRLHHEGRSESRVPSGSPLARRFPWRRTARWTTHLQSRSTLLVECRLPLESDNRAGSRPCRERILPSEPYPAPARLRLRS